MSCKGKWKGRDDCLSRYCHSLNEKLCPWEKRERKRVGGGQLWDQDGEHEGQEAGNLGEATWP